VKALGESAVTVLGNHDLHLLCVAEGVEKRKKRDTIHDVLGAPDCAELLHWLRHRPLLHAEENFVLVHAGLLPQWTAARARELAGEVESALRAPDYRALLAAMYGDSPAAWNEALTGIDRLRVVINAMTRLRVCAADGTMALEFKGEPGDADAGLMPWFDVPARSSADHTVVFGHWSALGLLLRPALLGLDSGCVWGRALSCVRLSDRQLFQVPCPALPAREA
jgi:bis(5'-nucleosyl)-tetraphosphatase (symmetrical)